MKSYIFGIFSLALLLLSAPFACSNSTDDCRNTSSCVPPAGGSSGSAEAGEAGSSASDGAGMGGGGQGDAGQGGGIGSAGEAGASGASGAAGGEPACDVSKSPSEESCLVNDEYAVFVAPTGKDGARGTQASPVKTLAKALQLASDGKIVIACDGTYDEQLTLTTGARLYGGFACPDNARAWTYEAGKKAKVAPSAPGLALSIASGNSGVVIQDCEFDAKDGVDPGQSSVAAFVNTSNHVELTRVKLVAGSGADGENGTLHKSTTFPTQAELNGHAASGDTGGAFNLRMCPAGGSTTGAVGGNGGPGATGGGIGVPALGGGTAGTLGASCGAGGTGQDGAPALPTSPALGAGKIGNITPEGWSGTAGGDGASGGPGQGGGGGAGAATGGGGGGGGAGGCGGPGGTGGKAGGSSIALLLLNSSPTLSGNELVSAGAGKGGNGAPGQDAQTQVGNGGLPDVNGGCAGGKGGAGAAGAAGGGGAGGISVGIAYRATQQISSPVLDAMTTISTGPAGMAGSGGLPGTNDGIAGLKKDVLYVP